MYLLSLTLEEGTEEAILELLRALLLQGSVLPQHFAALHSSQQPPSFHLPGIGFRMGCWVVVHPLVLGGSFARILDQVAENLYKELRLSYPESFYPLKLGLTEFEKAASVAEASAILREQIPQVQREYQELDYLRLTDAVDALSCLKLSVPHWFSREDFREWRQFQPYPFGETSQTEYADVIMTFDCDLTADCHWESSHVGGVPELPRDIFETIGRLLKSKNLRSGVLWLNPV